MLNTKRAAKEALTSAWGVWKLLPGVGVLPLAVPAC